MEKDSGVSCSQRILQTLSDDELKNKLCCQMLSDDAFDLEQVDAILAEIERRGLDEPPMSAEEAWEDFQENYAGNEPFYMDGEDALPQVVSEKPARKRHHRLRRLGILVAAIFLVFSFLIGVQATGMDVLGGIARWTEEVFSLRGMPEDNNIKQEENGPVSFETLQDALNFYQITELTEPKWLPEGYELSYVDVCQSEVGPEIYASYSTSGNKHLDIIILGSDGVHFSYCEKTDLEPLGTEATGITYYKLINEKSCIITWLTDNYECLVSGLLSQNDLERIALSMGGEVS